VHPVQPGPVSHTVPDHNAAGSRRAAPVLVDDSVPFQATSMLCTFANLATNSLNRVCSGDEPKETISFTSPNAQPKSVESSGSSRGHRT
jgi:hypothetical protein